MQKVKSKFEEEYYKAVRGVALTRHLLYIIVSNNVGPNKKYTWFRLHPEKNLG